MQRNRFQLFISVSILSASYILRLLRHRMRNPLNQTMYRCPIRTRCRESDESSNRSSMALPMSHGTSMASHRISESNESLNRGGSPDSTLAFIKNKWPNTLMQSPLYNSKESLLRPKINYFRGFNTLLPLDQSSLCELHRESISQGESFFQNFVQYIRTFLQIDFDSSLYYSGHILRFIMSMRIW